MEGTTAAQRDTAKAMPEWARKDVPSAAHSTAPQALPGTSPHLICGARRGASGGSTRVVGAPRLNCLLQGSLWAALPRCLPHRRAADGALGQACSERALSSLNVVHHQQPHTCTPLLSRKLRKTKPATRDQVVP